ncbi:hypothetical protein [Humisphaera borealis]|uniref:Tetratricopeptide repeat protein n=1 Tax=Humisphaera borealis TaxID=2807512 RepID=A0A7M2X3W2_9BACT|nr:hypothetical protein [Humisphaera borealis]QOV91711.1 hypothetical protein IPV69_10255 [Humisphaera borealis]
MHTRAHRPAVCLFILLCLTATTRAAEPARLATMDELRQMYDAGSFQVCLQQISRVSRLTGDAAKPYDKWALLLLKADCLLRMEDTSEALRTYRAAESSPVAKQAAEARATEFLIKKSQNLAYKPKTVQTPEPLAITVPQSRKKALVALLDDELAADRAKINQALEAKTLTPMFDIVPDLLTLWAVEVTGTGQESKTGPILTGLGERARTLIDRDLQVRREQLDGIRQKANQIVENRGNFWWQDGTTRRGLYTPDRKELRDLMTYLQKVEEVGVLAQKYAWQLGRDGKKWDAVITECLVIIADAEKVMEAN